MIALSWSGGKDAAAALDELRVSGKGPDLLLTTFDEEHEVTPHHHTPLELLRRQAASLGLPLVEVGIPPATSDVSYSERMIEAFEGPLAEVTEVAFGDLFLEDLRAYREDRMAEIGRRASFPLWGRDTGSLARDIARRFEAIVCAVDTGQLPGSEPGVAYDDGFLDRLDASADPCGERGEFHTFVHDGPGFDVPVAFRMDGIQESTDDGFWLARLTPVT